MSPLVRSVTTVSSTSFVLLALASARSQRARYYLNSMLYLFSMGVCSSIGVVCALLLSLLPGKRFNTNYVVARSFLTIAGTLLGYRMTLTGEEHLRTRPAIIVGNHQSFLDILYLGRMFPPRSIIMAKKELRFVPLLGQFMMLGGTAFIDRKSRTSAIKTMNHIGEHMRKNRLNLFIFPEGTRSYLSTPDLLPFKKGAFHLAIQTQLPVVPVVCENYHRMFDNKTRWDGGHIRLAALPPIETKGMTEKDVGALIEKVRTAMLQQLRRFDAELDRNDVEQSLHPSSQPQPRRLYGVAGLAARLIGTGEPKHHQRKMERIANDKPDTQGSRPADFGLVAENQRSHPGIPEDVPAAPENSHSAAAPPAAASAAPQDATQPPQVHLVDPVQPVPAPERP